MAKLSFVKFILNLPNKFETLIGENELDYLEEKNENINCKAMLKSSIILLDETTSLGSNRKENSRGFKILTKNKTQLLLPIDYQQF